MKRVVSSSFITLLIIVAVAAAFYYLKNSRNQGGDPVLAIPADAVFLISYNPGSEDLYRLLKMNVWPVLKSAPLFAQLENQLIFFDSTFHSTIQEAEFLGGQPMFLTCHVTGAGKFDFLFLKSLDNGFNESSSDELIKSITGSEIEFVRRNYDGNIIREVALEGGRIFSFVTVKGIFIASFTPFLVEDALRQLKLGKPVITDKLLLDQLRSSKNSSLCINYKNLPLFSGLFLEQNALHSMDDLKNYSDWALATVQPQKDKLLFTGLLTETDSAQFIHCFNGQQPVVKKLISILPRKTAVINYIGTSDFPLFFKKLSNQNLSASQKEKKEQLLSSILTNYKLKVEDKMLEWIGNEYALVITEPAGLSFENSSFAIFKAKNILQAKKSLTSISRIIDEKNSTATMEESYNGHGIGYIRLNGLIPALFGETFSKITKMYYTDINDYIIFANQASAIRAFIDEYKSGLLLHKTNFFQNAISSFPSKGNHFFFVRPPLATQIFKSMANKEWKKNVDQYKELIAGIGSFACQVASNDTLVRFNAAINFHSNKSKEGVNLIFAVETDTSVSMKPLVSTDPVTKSRQLIFQDDAKNLYLTDNSGNILWKQPVDGDITGEIFEIDLFKNNTRQFLFNTEEYLYLVDTKGSPVGNYPIRLPAAATNGISVFDFDENKDFKIYIACSNRQIYAYQPSGKPLPGWNFLNALDVVVDPIRSMTVNGQDILIITDRSGTIAVVNRFGEQGIHVSNEFTQARNSGIFITKSGSLLTTDASGSIIEIEPDGGVKSTFLNSSSAGHGFLYADADGNREPDYIFLDGNELTAYTNQLVLIYRKEFESVMNGPIQLITLKSGVQVMGIRSEESGTVWLLKMDGSIYGGFPVKGNTPVVIDELNMDGNKHLITGGKESLLYVYSIE